MESYEANIAQATARETREILGAIGIVFDKEGKFVLSHMSRVTSLRTCQERHSTTMHRAINL